MGYGADVIPRRCGPRGLRLTLGDTAIVPEAEGEAGDRPSLLVHVRSRQSTTGEKDLQWTASLATFVPMLWVHATTIMLGGICGPRGTHRRQTM